MNLLRALQIADRDEPLELEFGHAGIGGGQRNFARIVLIAVRWAAGRFFAEY
jgi:hypothetical protein